MSFRAFIAVEVPAPGPVREFWNAVKASGAPVKMVDPDIMHITLRFLGDTDEALVPDIASIMEETVSGVGSFDMRLRGTGAFPGLHRISVVWIGVEDAGPLVQMASRLETGIRRLGFEPDRKRFSPHLTVARVKGGRNRERLADTITRFGDTDFGIVRVDRIILKKSVLTPSGPVYSDVCVADLDD